MNEGELPTGTVTFLLTDVEGSTRLWQEHPDLMSAAVARHDELIEGAVADHGGVLVKSKGKGTQRSRSSPVLRTRWLLRRRSSALGAEPWPDGIDIRARAALHTGEGELRDCDYYGATINRCVRMRTVAHGGQTICSQATADRLADGLPAEVGLKASARIACATSSGPSGSSRSPARSSRRSSRSSHRSDRFDRGIAGNAR